MIVPPAGRANMRAIATLAALATTVAASCRVEPFACFTPELMADTAWQRHVEHLVFVHGFARSGTTLIGKQLRDAAGGAACWVGRTLSAEAQGAQDVYPAWETAPANPRNRLACGDAWANATTYAAKRDAVLARVGDRAAAAATLLSQWRIEGDVRGPSGKSRPLASAAKGGSRPRRGVPRGYSEGRSTGTPRNLRRCRRRGRVDGDAARSLADGSAVV